ncbi:MAG: hypothetical protein GY848_18065 [Methyloversatilis sp.]|jgi:hypothetical protein|uniref:Lipoprotein n=2 Tax=Pseudomonadota TaxID=1224 RepID=F5RGL3_METUF|nr:hypothetical protein [Methyloversatilis universalis]EGK70401.1 Putative lipoprotein [Methyloversatilis universalis FAM5]MCP4638370.1 hypothetical protein [Methyloversatilis sp.]
MGHTRLLTALLLVLVLGACSHPIVITPDADKISAVSDDRKINKRVGYYMTLAQRDAPVVTPGGGGDSIKYYPYRDIEGGFYRVLSNVFSDVTLLKSTNDQETLDKYEVVLIIKPEIRTTSQSSSIVTWPPTDFSVELTCQITDRSGKGIAETRVTGQGKAEFSEFVSDFSLAGKRASFDALMKTQDALLNLQELRGDR